ncbi:MAG: hypothetical protein L6W00_13365 [Lentisphaeria bacterium]|nr:MAG: hypothetical protein L6W00_13365 [Lentisphaeria bacterium]
MASWDHGMPPGDCSLNLFHLLALEAMEFLDPGHAAEYRASADESAAAIRVVYEVPGTGYAEDEAHTVFSEHAQVLATLSERLPHYAPTCRGRRSAVSASPSTTSKRSGASGAAIFPETAGEMVRHGETGAPDSAGKLPQSPLRLPRMEFTHSVPLLRLDTRTSSA